MTCQKNELITPDASCLFRAFKECPWSKLNTVILNNTPLPGAVDKIKVADGIAFSSRMFDEPNSSLSAIYDSIKNTIDKDFSPKLYWNQNLLFLNVDKIELA